MQLLNGSSTPTILLFPLLALWLLSCAEHPQNADADPATRSALELEIDSIGNAYIREGATKGFSIAVVRGQDTLYNRGFGYVDSLNEVRTTNAHRFLMASISKLITATIIMKLADEDKLSLDQTLAELLPEYPNRAQAEKIQLFHLLSHTSGLLDYALVLDSIYIETGRVPTKEDYYHFFNTHDLLFEPGTVYAYNNSGFWLAAMIIERVTGNAFTAEVDRVINKPTGLNLMHISEAVKQPEMSTYFELRDSVLHPTRHWTWFYGDGGLTSTSIDLAHFPHYWSNGTIISRESFQKMCAPVVFNNGITSGYGIGVRNGTFASRPVYGHTGGDQSIYAVMMFFPEDSLSVVVFDNTNRSTTSALDIIGPVANAALGLDAPNLEEMQLPDEDLSRYAGEYLQYGYVYYEPDTFDISFNPEDRHLYRKRKGSGSQGQKLYHVGEHEFAYAEYPMDRIVFELDDAGQAVAYKVSYNGLYKVMGFRMQ